MPATITQPLSSSLVWLSIVAKTATTAWFLLYFVRNLRSGSPRCLISFSVQCPICIRLYDLCPGLNLFVITMWSNTSSSNCLITCEYRSKFVFAWSTSFNVWRSDFFLSRHFYVPSPDECMYVFVPDQDISVCVKLYLNVCMSSEYSFKCQAKNAYLLSCFLPCIFPVQCVSLVCIPVFVLWYGESVKYDIQEILEGFPGFASLESD